MGGWVIGVYQLGFNSSIYIDSTLEYLETIDVYNLERNKAAFLVS